MRLTSSPSHPFRSIATLFLLVSALIAAWSQAGDVPDDKSAKPRGTPAFHDRVGWHLVNGIWLRATGTCRWTDLVHIDVRAGQLIAEIGLSPAAASFLRGGRRATVEIGPSRDLYVASSGDWRTRPGRTVSGSYLYVEAMPETGRVERLPLRVQMLSAVPGSFRVTAAGQYRTDDVTIALDCIAGKSIRLDVTRAPRAADPAAPANLERASYSAGTLAELIEQHPREVRLYLSPLLKRLAGADPLGPGAGDVYRAFSQIQPDAQALQTIGRILPDMNAADPRDRDAAMDRLRQTGYVGTIAALHLDNNSLSPQQNILIQQFLREQMRRPDLDAAALLRDPLFLVDCMEWDDARVRELTLPQLEHHFGRKIALDTNSLEACSKAAPIYAMKFCASSAICRTVNALQYDTVWGIIFATDRAPIDTDENRIATRHRGQ